MSRVVLDNQRLLEGGVSEGRFWAIFVGFNEQACKNREHYYDGPAKVRQNFLSDSNIPYIFTEFFRKPR